MKKLIIEGKHELTGTIKIGGAKNSVVALIPAAVLSDGICKIYNVPNITDVHRLLEMLEMLNVKTSFDDGVLTIDNTNAVNGEIQKNMQ